MFAKGVSPLHNFQLKGNLTDRQKESAHTSISRTAISMPLRILQPDLKKKESILDYGAGRGKDYIHLLKKGYKVSAYDPYIKGIDSRPKKADVVVSNYVLNTVRPNQRNDIIKDISKMSRNRAYITVRRTGGDGRPVEDGILTKKKTFQRYFTPEQLLNYSKRHFKTCLINDKITDGNTSSVICIKH